MWTPRLKGSGVAVAVAVVVVAFVVVAVEGVTIMSVDFGSEWMKVAVVAPGIPMEIALNKESKRKTPLAISFRGGERTFGEDALTNGVRHPPSTYQFLLDLLGKRADDKVVQVFQRRFPYYDIEADEERGTVVFRFDSNTTYSVEELVGQLLGHARDLAMAHTDQKIKDCVITVPAFFNQAERRTLMTAAKLTGLKVLSLMSSNAAVALNYGMFRRKEINATSHYILFYDMGASSTTATIASYQTVKTKEKAHSETNPQLTIQGVGYDRLLGGLEMQLRLRDHLAKNFEATKKTKNSVYDSPRAMAKLLKEAGRMAKILSANTEHLSQVEGVLDEEDFKLMVKREEFEAICEDLFERVRDPVDVALISAGMDITAIDQFIIVGGATRVPRIQTILQELWGKELGKNINADEAAAMGAVYRAADLGQGFKVKKFHVKEAVLFPIEVDFERKIDLEGTGAEGEPGSGGGGGGGSKKVVKRSLFAQGNNYPQKKVMTFNKHTSDFNFGVNYGFNQHLPKEELRMANVKNISSVQVEGVTRVFEEQLKDQSEPKGIKAHFNLDDSGILHLVGMEAVFERTVEEEVEDGGKKVDQEEESTLSKLGSTISKLFTGTEEEKVKEIVNELNKTDKDEEGKEQKQEGKQEGSKEEVKKEVRLKQVTLKEDLNFTQEFLDLKEMSEESVKKSKEKLEEIAENERVRWEKEAARNNLESYILDAQDKLYNEEYEKASTEEEREKVRELCSKLDEWIYEEGFNEQASVYRVKLDELSSLFEPIRRRVQEHNDRPEAIQALKDIVNSSSTFLKTSRSLPEDQQLFTEVEMKTLSELIESTKSWLQEKTSQQSTLALHQDPKLTISEIAEKWNSLDREIKYLINKAKITKAKKEREAAEAKIKEEKDKKKKEEEKKKQKKNETQAEKEEKVSDEEDQQQQQQGPVKTEEEDSKDDPLNIFEEATEENNREEDRRKEEVEEVEEVIDEGSDDEGSGTKHVEL